ncbi:MAG: MFS transporter [Chloroflexota bacterium]|nr:MFS transporter [Chloroflexota bacterium]
MAEQHTGEHPRPWPARLPFFYGWVIVAITFVMGFITAGAFWATSVIAVPMRDDLGWSLSDIYLGLTMRMLIGAASIFFLGRFADLKHGARILAIIGSVVATLSLVGVAYVEEQWQFFALYGIVGGFSVAGAGFLLMSAVVPRWFFRKRGRAMAFATMGSGAAAFVLPPLFALVLEAVGWRGTWVFLGVLTGLMTSARSLVVWRQREEGGLAPDGGIEPVPAGRAAAVQHVRDHTLSEAVRTPLMWVLVFALASASLSPNGVPSTLVPMFIDKGHTTQTAALGFSIYGLFSVLARFFWGFLAERYHIRTVIISIALFSAVSMPLLIFLTGDVALLYAAFAGFGIGGLIGTNSLVWPAYFGRRHLGAIVGVSRPFETAVMASGPLLMAQSFDRTGGYTFGLWAMGISWLLCAGAMLLARPPRPVAETPPGASTTETARPQEAG